MTFAFMTELLVKSKANKEPIAAKGIENIKTTGALSDSKTEAKIINITTKAASIKKVNSLSDSPELMNSNPPQAKLFL